MAATRVLTLATESLDMMRGVTGVFRESLDRAELWVDRLQQLGLQRQQQQRHALPYPESTSTLAQFSATRASYDSELQRTAGVGAESSFRYTQQRQTTHSPSPSTQAASEYGSDDGNATETEEDTKKGMDVDG